MSRHHRFFIHQRVIVFFRRVAEYSDQRDGEEGKKIIQQSAPRRHDIRILKKLKQHKRKADYHALAKAEIIAIKTDRKYGRKRDRASCRQAEKLDKRQRESRGKAHCAVCNFSGAGYAHNAFFLFDNGRYDKKQRHDGDDDGKQQDYLPWTDRNTTEIKHKNIL